MIESSKNPPVISQLSFSSQKSTVACKRYKYLYRFHWNFVYIRCIRLNEIQLMFGSIKSWCLNKLISECEFLLCERKIIDSKEESVVSYRINSNYICVQVICSAINLCNSTDLVLLILFHRLSRKIFYVIKWLREKHVLERISALVCMAEWSKNRPIIFQLSLSAQKPTIAFER